MCWICRGQQRWTIISVVLFCMCVCFFFCFVLSLHDTQLETVTIIERVTKEKKQRTTEKNSKFSYPLFIFLLLYFYTSFKVGPSDKMYSQRKMKQNASSFYRLALPPTAQRLKALRRDFDFVFMVIGRPRWW